MHFYRLFLILASRPSLFGFWLFIRKLSAHALNLSAAARLGCDLSGEQIALDYILSKVSTDSKLTIFDVGASVGDYTDMCLRHLMGVSFTKPWELYAFEPTSASAECLEKRFNSNPQVHICKFGLRNKAGEHSIFVPWPTCGAASTHNEAVDLWPTKFPSQPINEIAQFATVDEFVSEQSLGNIQFLKIDVEGDELKVIEGARRTIESGKIQFIQFEISGATMLNKTYLLDFWRQLSSRYRFFLIMNQGLAEIADYNPHLENFSGASNFLLELKT